MPLTTSSNIKQALVATLRGNTSLKAAIRGVYEGFAPAKTKYPFVTYNFAVVPYDFAWGSVMIRAMVDIYVFSENSVEANNLDALVLNTLQDASLGVTGQSTLFCRRVMDLSDTDVDEEGKKVYQIGGTYSIWTDQSL
jgi:hypothetical protein